MKVLVCKNIKNGAQSSLERYLIDKNIAHTVIDLADGQPLPVIKQYDTLVLLGGYMSAFQGDEYPFLNAQIEAVKEFYKNNKKILGLCLGAQIMALAFGASVYTGKEKELGWKDLTFGPVVHDDPLLCKISQNGSEYSKCQSIKVLEWHGDTFNIPEGAQVIGSTKLYPHQGFRLEQNVYAFQFHLEVTKEMIQEWIEITEVDGSKVLNDTELYLPVFQKRAYKFYKEFFTA